MNQTSILCVNRQDIMGMLEELLERQTIHWPKEKDKGTKRNGEIIERHFTVTCKVWRVVYRRQK